MTTTTAVPPHLFTSELSDGHLEKAFCTLLLRETNLQGFQDQWRQGIQSRAFFAETNVNATVPPPPPPSSLHILLMQMIDEYDCTSIRTEKLAFLRALIE